MNPAVPWCLRLAIGTAPSRSQGRYCAWGWREGWVQIGSPEDRYLQQVAGMAANFERLGSQVGEALLSPFQRLAAELAGVARGKDRAVY